MKLLLTTLHAKYSHASLALPCLAAYCRDIPGCDPVIREWTVNEPREYLLKLVMAEQADVIAFSCYIWNIEQTLKIVADIKKIAPHCLIVLGGPEVSFGMFELMADNPAIDFVIKGEGEEPFRRLLSALTGGDTTQLADIDNLFFRDGGDTAAGPLCDRALELDLLPSPFRAGLVDLAKPLIYYETSRGCPFSCAFCLSATEGSVRSFSMERIKADLLFLMEKEVHQIKLVDRTFNYDARRADDIWTFILENNRSSTFHFEIAADLLSDANLKTLAQVPADTFRFEIGIQSASAEVLQQVKRNADLPRIFDSVRRLSAETAVDLHLDLIAGLPGEGYEGFLGSLQTVAALNPGNLQIEPLKLLKGAPMREIARRHDYRFSDAPPYTLLGNPWLSYHDICRIETIGRLLDLFARHGGCRTALQLLQQELPFAAVLDRMACRAGSDNLSSLSCRSVFELFARLAEELVEGERRDALHDCLFFDYCRQELPLKGRLPSFAAGREADCTWPTQRDLPDGLELPTDSRIRLFRYNFRGDYRKTPWGTTETPVTFIYISGSNRGLQVHML